MASFLSVSSVRESFLINEINEWIKATWTSFNLSARIPKRRRGHNDCNFSLSFCWNGLLLLPQPPPPEPRPHLLPPQPRDLAFSETGVSCSLSAPTTRWMPTAALKYEVWICTPALLRNILCASSWVVFLLSLFLDHSLSLVHWSLSLWQIDWFL